MELTEGDRVVVKRSKEKGTVRYIGNVSFAKGKFVGIELDQPNGKNDGSVGGNRYFQCEANHGLFVRDNGVHLEGENPTSAEETSKIPIPPSRSESPTQIDDLRLELETLKKAFEEAEKSKEEIAQNSVTIESERDEWKRKYDELKEGLNK